MHLYKRSPKGPWWVEFRENNRRHRFSTNERNRVQAERFAAAARTRMNLSRVGIRARVTYPDFQTAMRDYLKHIKTRTAPRTHTRYSVASRALLAAFGKRAVDTITRADTINFQSRRLSGKSRVNGKLLKPSSVNREMGIGRQCFNWLGERFEDLQRNPFKVKFSTESEGRMLILDQEQEQRYLGVCGPMLYDAAVLALDVGLRMGEICALTGDDIHLSDNLAESWLQVEKGKSRAARRRLPLTARAHAVLSMRLSRVKGRCLFPSPRHADRGCAKLNTSHGRARELAGLPELHFHDLRHTFASRAAMSGCDLATLSSLLGHSRVQMSMRYTHVSAPHQANAVAKLDAFNQRQIAEANAKKAAESASPHKNAHTTRLQ
jgi:integrase